MKIPYSPTDVVASLVVFLFPVSVVLLAHGGGAVLGLGAIIGLFHLRRTWPLLTLDERKIFAAFAFCVAAMSVSLINTDHMDEGVRRLEKILQLLILLPVYFTLRQARGLQLAYIFYLGIAFAALLFWIQAIKEISVIGVDGRAKGAYYEILFGDIATLYACMLVAGAFTLRISVFLKTVALVAALAAMHASILSGTRGGWILIPILALGATAYGFSRHRLKFAHVVILTMLMAGALTAILLTENRISKGFNNALEDFKHYDTAANTSVGARINMWIDSVKIWREHPVIGTGIGDFSADQQRMIDTGLSRSTEAWGHAHNIFIDTLASSGLIGLTGMTVGLFIIPFMVFWRLWRQATVPQQYFCALTGVLTVVSFSVFGLTEGWLTRNPFVRSYVYFVLTLMAAYFSAQPSAAGESSTTPVSR